MTIKATPAPRRPRKPLKFLGRSLAVAGFLALGNQYAPVIDGVTAATKIIAVPPLLTLSVDNRDIGGNATITMAEGERISITVQGGDTYGYPVAVMLLSALPGGAQFPGNLAGYNPAGAFTWTPPVGTAASSPVNMVTFASYNPYNKLRTVKSVTIKVSVPAQAKPDCLFNWAEKNYPNLFSPVGYPTSVWSIYTYRWYSATNAYLGVSSQDNHVYYMGADGLLQDEGPLSDWLPRAGCQ